jgi:hypothetical protein
VNVIVAPNVVWVLAGSFWMLLKLAGTVVGVGTACPKAVGVVALDRSACVTMTPMMTTSGTTMDRQEILVRSLSIALPPRDPGVGPSRAIYMHALSSPPGVDFSRILPFAGAANLTA